MQSLLTLLTVAVLICPPTIMENRSGSEWNDLDYEFLERVAGPGCVERYPEAPCVGRFIKFGEKNWFVQCVSEIPKGACMPGSPGTPMGVSFSLE